MNNTFPIPVLLLTSILLASPAVRADVETLAPRATAYCTDNRVAVHTNGSESASYQGHELVTQEGDRVTVEFLPDGVAGFGGNAITYERITREDAHELGFSLATGISVYMLHGDEGLPAEFVILPTRLAESPSGRFTGAYGSLNDDNRYDSRLTRLMTCERR